MDLTSLFAGPAPAGPSPSAAAAAAGAGAGHIAGPAPADAPAAGGFASLVDLALEQIAGTPADETPICGASPSHADGDPVEETGATPSSGDHAGGAIDDLTLAVQLALALALPVAATAAPAIETPVVTGGGTAATPGLTAIVPVSIGAGVEAVVDGAPATGAPSISPAPVPAPAAPGAFAEAVGTVIAEAPAADAQPLNPPESQAAAIDPVASARPAPPTASAADAPAATSTPAPATTPTPAPATTTTPAPATTTTPAPATTTTSAPAAAGADAASRLRAPQGARPALHRALAALAAQAPADPAAVPTSNVVTQPHTASSPAPAPVATIAEPAGVTDGPARIAAAVPGLAEGAVARIGARGRAASGEASADTSSDAQPFVPMALAPQAAAGAATTDVSFAAPQPSTAIPPANAAILQAGFAVPMAVPAPSGDASRAIELPTTTVRFEQTLAALDPDVRNLQSMVRTVRLFTSSGVSEARLQLEPDHLGPVALTVRVEQGTVSAHFRAETPAAQRWIETHQHELRSGLREQGLEVKDVVVTTDPDARRDRRQEAQPTRTPRGRRAQAGDDAPRFEVVV